jgi:hypothetical protein
VGNNSAVNNGVDSSVLLQLLQGQQMQLAAHQAAMEQQRQTNELLQKQLQDMAQQAQGRADRPDSRPLPEFKGKSFTGEPSMLESWIREARMQVVRLAPAAQTTARAVDFVAQAFTGPALVWFVHEIGAAAKPSSPEDLFALMLARFQPKLAAEEAVRQLFSLAQGKTSVTEYSTRFRELLALLPVGSISEAVLVQRFADGLVDSVHGIVVQAVPQPATMEAMVEMATRVESRAQSGRRAAAQVAAAEVEQPGTSQAILAALSSISQQLAASGRGAQGSGNSRREGQPGRAAGRSNRPEWRSDDPLNAQSPEQRKKLMEKQLCFYCAQPGHRRPDCPVAARGAPPTPAALGN